MNTLTRSLAEFCRAHPGDEKWLDRAYHPYRPPVDRLRCRIRRAAAEPACPHPAQRSVLQLALPSPDKPQLETLRSLDSLLLCGSLFQAGQERGETYLLSLRPVAAPAAAPGAAAGGTPPGRMIEPANLTGGLRHRLKGR